MSAGRRDNLKRLLQFIQEDLEIENKNRKY